MKRRKKIRNKIEAFTNEKDFLYAEQVLHEAVTDILECRGKQLSETEPVMETWINLWKDNSKFREFILQKQATKRCKQKRKIVVHRYKEASGFRAEIM